MGLAFCGIHGASLLHSGFDVWASGDAIVGSWPYRMYLGFLPRQYVYAVFGWCLFASGAALGVALRSSTCPSWLQSYGSLGIFQASACALRFLPRTGFGTFSGAVFAWICSIAQLRWRSLQPPKLCAVSLSASSTSLAVLGGASQLQSGGSPLQFACCVADLLTVLAWCALQAVLSSAAVRVLYSSLVSS